MPFGAKLPVKDAHICYGDLAAYAGIASEYVTAWADALSATPAAIEAAVKEVPPLMDTAKQKGRKKRDLATVTHLRCIAWETRDLLKVRAALRK